MLRLDGNGPLYQQVYRTLRDEILSGERAPGERVPSTRVLASDLHVSRNTAVSAFEQLLAEGYVETRSGAAGSVVTASLQPSGPIRNREIGSKDHYDAKPRLSNIGQRVVEIARRRAVHWQLRPVRLPYDFRLGRPAFADIPHALWCRLLARRARRARLGDLDYGPPEGQAELREVLAKRLRRSRGVETTADQIVVVNGSQQALDLIARVLLNPGDKVLIEEPHYTGAHSAFAGVGAVETPSPVDEDGIQVPKITARQRTPRLVYVTPSHQFPTGVVMPLARRLELLRWASSAGAFVVEDDYDSEYRYDGTPLQALAGLDREGRVIYVGTFSKILYPALRLGYIVAPKTLREALVGAKANADTGTATLEQLAMSDFIREGHFDRWMRKANVRNACRRNALVEALNEYFGDRAEVCGANAGLHLLVWLRGQKGRTIEDVRTQAEKVGVALYSVSSFYTNPPRRAGVVLGYAALHEREIKEGIRRLASVLY